MAHIHRTLIPVADWQARLETLVLWLWPLAIGLLMTLGAAAARAQGLNAGPAASQFVNQAAREAAGDPPGRVGRLASLQGLVYWFDQETGQWAEADRNRPLTTGDRVSTGVNGRAELRVGSSVLRLAPASELEVLRLDDERMAWQLHSGSLALRVRNREAAQETDIVTSEVRLQPDTAGHYRIDRVDDTSTAGVWRGSLRAQEPGAARVIEAGQRLDLWRERGRDRGRWAAEGTTMLHQRASRWVDDAFSAWVMAEDRQDERSAAYRYVSPEMTGAEELDRHGRWEQHPEHGAIWIPVVTVADWAPYRYGRWSWVQPWGWTWVDDARWGFAPFHYGRWVNWRGRWGWCPGTYQARPVFAPALVAWVGGPRLGVSVSIGLPAVAWVPLAPRERFVPHYRHSLVYVGRVNVHQTPHSLPSQPGRALPPPAHHTGPVMYSNQGVPGAVTVVPRDVLLRRQPVARAVVDEHMGPQRPDARGPVAAWETVAPPAVERTPRPVVVDRDERRLRPERAVDRRDDGRTERRDESRDGGRDDNRYERDRGNLREPAPVPAMAAEPTRPARGPALLPPVQAPAGVGTIPPVHQPPQPARQTTPPLAPAVVGPAGPVAPRIQVPPTASQVPDVADGRRREPRDVDRRGPDMPGWSAGPQQPAAPAQAVPAPAVKPAIVPVPAPAPVGPAPAAKPPSAAPAAPSAQPPATPAAPAPRAERPRDPPAATDRPAADKPSRTEGADPDEGRKRGPGHRDRDRETQR